MLYAGLDQAAPVLTKAEAAAEAYAERLVEYDWNSAARTTVINDQSDLYEIEGNIWLSKKVLFNEDEASEMESRNSILKPPDEREVNKIKPNPTLGIQPIFL
ncbi:hypothetical protein NL676_028988 [Syzygium grande]|nr:hypothetical protein NL676_028988 [Syzygium grande]